MLQGFLPFAIVVGIGYYLVLNRSRFGFDLRVSGANPTAARAVRHQPEADGADHDHDLRRRRRADRAGAAAGRPQYYKYGDQFPQALGFTGLSLALLGRNHPVGIAAAALVWATIERATQRLASSASRRRSASILQGSFLLAAVDRLRGRQAPGRGRRGERPLARANADVPMAPTPPPIALDDRPGRST